MPPNRHHGKRPTGPVPIERLVSDCLGPVIARQGFGSSEILTAWPDIVGPELATRTRPERIRWPRRRTADAGEAATLVVRAEGGDALEIQHMTGEILARINTFLGWGAVGRLKVRQAPVQTAPLAAAVESGRLSRKPADPDDTPRKAGDVEGALNGLRRARAAGQNNST